MAKQCLPLLSDLDSLMDALRFLTSFAVEIREPGRRRWASQRCHLCHTPDTRTVRRRLEKLLRQAKGTRVAAVIKRLSGTLPPLVPAVGLTFRPTTSNAVEHCFAAFARFSRLTGPFQHEASAQKHLALCMLGLVPFS